MESAESSQASRVSRVVFIALRILKVCLLVYTLEERQRENEIGTQMSVHMDFSHIYIEIYIDFDLYTI